MGFDGGFMVVLWDIPSGKRSHNCGKYHHEHSKIDQRVSISLESLKMVCWPFNTENDNSSMGLLRIACFRTNHDKAISENEVRLES